MCALQTIQYHSLTLTSHEAYKEIINVRINNEKIIIILLSVIIKRNGHVFVDHDIYRLELPVSIVNSCAYFRSTFKLFLSSVIASKTTSNNMFVIIQRNLEHLTHEIINEDYCRLECSPLI